MERDPRYEPTKDKCEYYDCEEQATIRCPRCDTNFCDRCVEYH